MAHYSIKLFWLGGEFTAGLIFLEKSQNCYSHYSDSLETYSQKDAKMRQMDTPVTACNGIPVFVFIMCGGFHIYHNVCFWCVDDNKVSDNYYDIGGKCQGRIFLKPICGS